MTKKWGKSFPRHPYPISSHVHQPIIQSVTWTHLDPREIERCNFYFHCLPAELKIQLNGSKKRITIRGNFHPSCFIDPFLLPKLKTSVTLLMYWFSPFVSQSVRCGLTWMVACVPGPSLGFSIIITQLLASHLKPLKSEFLKLRPHFAFF